MKIIVFDKNTKIGHFNTYGYGKLREVKECKIIEELNGRYEAEVTVRLSDKRVQYLKKWAILMINGQLFRITNIETKDKEFTVKCYARHIFYDIDFGFIEDNRAENKTMEEALQIAIPDGFKMFSVKSDITNKKNIYYVKNNGVNAVFRTIERWGEGELVRDNFKIAVNKSKGSDKGVTFTYKKLDAITVTHDLEDVITRLYPTGKEGISLKEKYIEIPQWNEEDYLPYHITKEVKFEDAENEGDLRAYATEYAKKIGLGKTNFKIDVADLLYTDLYQDVPQLMSVEVGDIVTIKHAKLDLRLKVKVIKKEEDLVNKRVILELGQALDNFFKSVDNSNVSVDMPSMEQYVDGLYYYSNGADISIFDDKARGGYLTYSVQFYAHLLVYINVFLECKKDATLSFRVKHDNEYLPLVPTEDITVGNRIISFTYPLLGVKENLRHDLEVEIVCEKGNIIIPKNQLHIMLKGQGISGGGAERPHAEIIEQFDIKRLDTTDLITNTDVRISLQKPKIHVLSDRANLSLETFTGILTHDIINTEVLKYIPEEE